MERDTQCNRETPLSGQNVSGAAMCVGNRLNHTEAQAMPLRMPRSIRAGKAPEQSRWLLLPHAWTIVGHRKYKLFLLLPRRQFDARSARRMAQAIV